MSKIMVWLVYPFSLGILLLIFAYGAVLLRKRSSFHILFWAAFLILYLFGIQPVSDFLLKPLERKHLSQNPLALKGDAIVVLAGDVKKRIFPRSDIELGGNRVIKAIRLFRQKAAPVIIMTGGSGDLFDPDFKEAVSMKELAMEFGVPGEKIMVETRSKNTRENVVYTKQILDKIGAKGVILVTSAFHLPRAYALFKKIGMDAVPVAADFCVTDERYDPFSLIPNSYSLSLSAVAIKEYVGLFVYRLRGWI